MGFVAAPCGARAAATSERCGVWSRGGGGAHMWRGDVRVTASATRRMAVTMDAAGSGEKAADAADGSSQKQRGLFEKKDNRAEDDVHESWYIYQQPGNKCVVCLGQGEERCLYCYGAGSVVIGTSAERDTKICQMCEGAGKNTCIRCEGSGVRPDWRWADDGVGKVPNKTNADVCKEMVFDLSKYQITKEKKPAASASTEDAVETDTDVDEKATKDSVTAAHK